MSLAPATPVPARPAKGVRDIVLTATLAVTLTAWALLLRLWDLGRIRELVFDEVYYVRDGYTLIREGVEHKWAKDTSKAAFEAGNVDSYLDTPQYVVHPPGGKWVIGLGELLLGADTPWGWRISVAVVGSLGVLLLFFTVKRLLHSRALAFTAGFLLSIDGVHLTHSRTGLLDLILGFFCLLAFFFLLLDRDSFRRSLSRALNEGRVLTGVAGIRWWRIAAGISLGLACSVKWSGLYFMAVFGIMTVLWDLSARRRSGDPRWHVRGIFSDGTRAFASLVGLGATTYIATWSGWFATRKGYFRTWAEENGWEDSNPVVQALVSLWHYHREAYAFHVSLSSEHTYSAAPYLWLLQLRPTSFYYRSLAYGEEGCLAHKCSAAITNVGNPLIWWLGTAALIVTLFIALLRWDSRAFAILSGIVAGYLPWFAYLDRTVFQFYAVVFEPWLIMALVFVASLALGPPGTSPRHRLIVGAIIGSLLVTIVLLSAFFWPIWTGEVITYEQWRSHMWLASWI